jgi:hypothetical protein
MTANSQDAQIGDVLAILGANTAAKVTIAANRGLNSMPGYEYVVKLRSDPSRTLVLPTSAARALLAAGAALMDD